jgi:hypothetical protein
MTLYRWEGPEEELCPFFTATGLMVETLERGNAQGDFVATGRIDTYDHIEGCDGVDKWTAKSALKDGELHWEVEACDAFWHSKDGRPRFTLGDEGDQGIIAFVSKKLSEFLRLREGLPVNTPTIIDSPLRYSGEMVPYVGPCVCNKLTAANATKPFPWAELTKGKFPKRCFMCSCGRQYWCHGLTEEEWVPVGDPAAWTMLTEYDGEPTEPIGVHPKTLEIYTLRAVRAEGFIPIG